MPVIQRDQVASEAPTVEALRTQRARVLDAGILRGKGNPLDHFYEALTRGSTVRIVHFGDSPTTGDLITADARTTLQKEFGNAGAGFGLIAKPWAWYNHRGVV